MLAFSEKKRLKQILLNFFKMKKNLKSEKSWKKIIIKF